MSRYNKLNEYYKNKFGERVLKICVDGGFTCPNRDGSKGKGGCAFCSAMGSGELIKYHDIREQIVGHLGGYRGQRADKFIVFFQSYSNTYSDIDTLMQKYNSVFVDDRIIGISVATRPDCINIEVVRLLQEIATKHYVMVELGLQIADDNILNSMNVQYHVADCKKAVAMRNEAGIDVVAHIIVGLPGESMKSIDRTIALVNQYKIAGVKIHNLYVAKGTVIEKMYNAGTYKPLTLEVYLDRLEYIITRLKPEIVIHRISGDSPKDLLVAPDWDSHKKLVLNGIERNMKLHGTTQGCYYKK